MNTDVVDVFDKIVLALFKPGNLFPNAMLQAGFDRHPLQQPARMSLAFLPIWPERFDFRVLDVAAQYIAQSDDIRSREFVQAVALSVMRVDA